MRKDTKTLLFIWDDAKALAFTRHMNRYDNNGANHIAHLDGARIELTVRLTREQIKGWILAYNIEIGGGELASRPTIFEADVTFRNCEAPFVDLFLNEDEAADADRVVNPIPYQECNVNKTWGL